jgi:hypothetical protein
MCGSGSWGEPSAPHVQRTGFASGSQARQAAITDLAGQRLPHLQYWLKVSAVRQRQMARIDAVGARRSSSQTYGLGLADNARWCYPADGAITVKMRVGSRGRWRL